MLAALWDYRQRWIKLLVHRESHFVAANPIGNAVQPIARPVLAAVTQGVQGLEKYPVLVISTTGFLLLAKLGQKLGADLPLPAEIALAAYGALAGLTAAWNLYRSWPRNSAD